MIQKIGVVGAGQMGNGIAHVAALAGYDVKVVDIDAERVSLAKGLIEANMSRQVRRTLIDESEMLAALDKIQFGTDYATFTDRDIVIEAATENESVKREVFKALAPHIHENTILATNTSSISITRLGARTDRPEKFIGLHFMKDRKSVV